MSDIVKFEEHVRKHWGLPVGEFMKTLHNELLIGVLSGNNDLVKILQLESSDRDYIDYITPEQLTSPVMIGFDVIKRPFIVLKVKLADKIFSQVFFQRYIDDVQTWVSAAVNNQPSFIVCGGGVSLQQGQLINSLIDGEKVVLEKGKLYRYDSSFEGKEVTLAPC